MQESKDIGFPIQPSASFPGRPADVLASCCILHTTISANELPQHPKSIAHTSSSDTRNAEKLYSSRNAVPYPWRDHIQFLKQIPKLCQASGTGYWPLHMSSITVCNIVSALSCHIALAFQDLRGTLTHSIYLKQLLILSSKSTCFSG